jgi:hypothetical protein
VTRTGSPGLVQQLELRRLVQAAGGADAVVVFRIGVGNRLHEGSPLAQVHGGDLPDPVVRAAVVLSRERSFDQDPMLAFRLLADIALRALSPAVNDPATAVDAIDAMEDLLQTLAARKLSVADIPDGTGRTRVRLVLPTWADYVRAEVEDLLPAAATSPMVLGRLQRLLADLIGVSPVPAHAGLRQLHEHVSALVSARRSTLAAEHPAAASKVPRAPGPSRMRPRSPPARVPAPAPARSWSRSAARPTRHARRRRRTGPGTTASSASSARPARLPTGRAGRPRPRVTDTSDRKVVSALRPTEAPTYRGWMNVWMVTLRML